MTKVDDWKKQLGIVSPSKEMMARDLKKVRCPHCGYEMPITYDPETVKCNSVFVRCKGRGCKELFEINLGTK